MSIFTRIIPVEVNLLGRKCGVVRKSDAREMIMQT
jgi:hypothetical protein